MPEITTCPDAAELQRFVLGHVTGPAAEALEWHLRQCPRCVDSLATLGASDSLVDAARAGQTESPTPAAVSTELTAGPPAEGWLGLLNPREPDPSLELEAIVRRLAPSAGPDELGRLGPYRILEVIGVGGMGVVFRADEPQLKRRVALKTMKPRHAADPSARQRFLREAQSAAAVQADHVVTIYQVGEDNGIPFLAMPLLDGETLEARLEREKKLPVAEAVRVGREIAEGLAAAHGRGLIHRDIKPANVWLEAGRDRVKILDFGLARAAGDQLNLTAEGALIGTPNYIAPEQGRGRGVDHRADLFSLGAVLYRLLTGEQPFPGSSVMAVLMAVAESTPRPVTELAPDVPPALAALVRRMLRKSADDRPASANEVVAELERIAAASGTGTAPKRRSRRPLALAAAALLGLGVVGWLFGGAIVRFATDKGELVVEVDDPNIDVTVKQDAVTVVDRKKEYRFVLTAKGGEVEFHDPKTGVRLLTKEFTLERGGKTVVRAREELAAARKRPPARGPAGTLDALHPSMIPASERFPWQPKELVAVLGEHRGRPWGRVDQLAFSPDGKTVGTGGDGMLCLWDAATLHPVAHYRGVSSFAFSANRMAIFRYEGRRLWLLDTAGERKELASLQVPDTVDRLAFRPDGKMLAGSFHFDMTVRLWDVSGDKLTERAVLKGHTAQVCTLAFAPDGTTLASGDLHTRTIRVWDLTGKDPREKASFKQVYPLFQVAFSPDGKLLASNQYYWDLTEANPKPRRYSSREARSVAFAPAGRTIVLGLSGWMMEVVDLSGLEPRSTAAVKSSTDMVAVAPDGKSLVSSHGGKLRLWDLTGPEPRERIDPPGAQGHVASLGLTRDGRTLAVSAEADPVVRLWDLSRPAPRERATVRRSSGHASVSLAPDGKTLAVIRDRAHVDVWDLAAPEPEMRISFWTNLNEIGEVVFAPDSRTLAVWGHLWKGPGGVPQEQVRLWDVAAEPPAERSVLPNATRPIEFSPDGKSLIARREIEKARFQDVWWDITVPQPRERTVLNPVTPNLNIFGPTAWSLDGKTLAVAAGHAPSRVLLWNLNGDRPKERGLLDELMPSTEALALTADGRRLACSNYHGEVSLVDIASRRRLAYWRLPGGVMKLTFAPDGRHLLLGNSNGTVYVLRVPVLP